MLSAFAAFLTRTVRPQTIRIYVSAVRNLHIELGYEDPTTKTTLLPRVLRGIDRCHGLGDGKPRLPVTIGVLRKLVNALEASRLHSVEDKTMLRAAMLTAFYGFLRCSEFTCHLPYNATFHLSRQGVTFTPRPPAAMTSSRLMNR